jgi:hypothetical protein
MQSMLNSPQFMQQMSSLMNNPAIVDQVIASNPQLAAMGPRVREAFQDEGFRQMMYFFPPFSLVTSLTNFSIGPTLKLYNKCYVWHLRLVVPLPLVVPVDTEDLDRLSVPNNQHSPLQELLVRAPPTLPAPPALHQQLLLQQQHQHLLQYLHLSTLFCLALPRLQLEVTILP